MQPPIQSLIPTATTPSVPEAAQAPKSDASPTVNFATVLAANRHLRDAQLQSGSSKTGEPPDEAAEEHSDAEIGAKEDSAQTHKRFGKDGDPLTPATDVELSGAQDKPENTDLHEADARDDSLKPRDVKGLAVPSDAQAALNLRQQQADDASTDKALDVSQTPTDAAAPKPRAPFNLWQTAVMPAESLQANADNLVKSDEAAGRLAYPLGLTPATSQQEVVGDARAMSDSATPTAKELSATTSQVGAIARGTANGGSPQQTPVSTLQSSAGPVPAADSLPTAAGALPRVQNVPQHVAIPTARPSHFAQSNPRRAAQAEDIRREPSRSGTAVPMAKPAPAQLTAQVAPVISWQSNAILMSDQLTTKELVTFDPITGEPRLAPSVTGASTTAQISRAELPSHIGRQLAEVIQQQPNRTVEIMLKPQELGAVRMSLHQAESGIVVNLVAERPETLDLMRRNIDQLGAEFQEMGYTDIAFSFAGTDADPDPQQQQKGDQSTDHQIEPGDDTPPPGTNIHLSHTATSGVDLRL